MLALATGLVGAFGAMVWSYLMASRVAAPRAKRLIVESLRGDTEEARAVRECLVERPLEHAFKRVDLLAERISAVEGMQDTLEGMNDALRDFTEVVNNIPKFDKEELADELSDHLRMLLKERESIQAQRTAEVLAEIEPQFKQLDKEMQAELVGRMDAISQVAYEIMQAKIPKGAGPVTAMLLRQAKILAAQQLEALREGVAEGQGGPVARATVAYSPGR